MDLFSVTSNLFLKKKNIFEMHLMCMYIVSINKSDSYCKTTFSAKY